MAEHTEKESALIQRKARTAPTTRPVASDERVRWLVCEIRNVLRSAVSRFTEREVPNHTLDEIFKFGGLFGGRILV